MQYYLYPPFFVIEPETSFDDAWEAFCCELLNLENHINTIRRRRAPDLGCDLIWEEKEIAYQCKASENGQAGKLNTAKVIKSIQTALAHRAEIGWNKYILCTNVTLTGKQERSIKEALPDIEFLTLPHWRDLCKKYPSASDIRCRQLVSIPQRSVVRAIDEVFLEKYAQKIRENSDIITLLVHSNRRQTIFELPVSRECSVEDVLEILIKVFQLPGQRVFRDIQANMSLSYSLVINDEPAPLEKKLYELSLPLHEKPLVTFWKTINCIDERGQSREKVMEFLTELSSTRWLPFNERAQIAIQRYEQEINVAFDRAIVGFKRKKR